MLPEQFGHPPIPLELMIQEIDALSKEEIIKVNNRELQKLLGWELINLNEDPADEDYDLWIFKNKHTKDTWSGGDSSYINKDDTLPFDCDWCWLMSAFVYVNNMEEGYGLKYNIDQCQVILYVSGEPKIISEYWCDGEQLCIYLCLVEFAKYYNYR